MGMKRYPWIVADVVDTSLRVWPGCKVGIHSPWADDPLVLARIGWCVLGQCSLQLLWQANGN